MTKKNRIMDLCKHLKCSISKCDVSNEYSMYFFKKTKAIVFKVATVCAPAKISWHVKRAETDFYLLRSILSMSFTQCFVPPLAPTSKETLLDNKSLLLRGRSFSRFLRGVVRTPTLLNHHLVIEFLKIDHNHTKSKFSMKDFTKKLINAEADLTKELQVLKK